MTVPDPIDLARLRRSCAKCSLHELCVPAGVNADELRQLERIVQRNRRIERGERLFWPGAPLAGVYVAREGAFKTTVIDESGEEQVLGFHLPGEVIGLDAMGTGVHRCEAVALATAEVCEIPFAQLTAVAAQLPSLQQQLMRVIGQGVDRDQVHLGVLVRRQANERVALFLHGLGERLRTAGQSATRIRLPMSREDIARYLGLALETVSRGFSRLQEDGVIEVTGRQVEVVDAALLARLAHGVEERVPRRGRIA
ncbi:helix-turn-helix domain-containing protein [Lysobacter sp. A3-1-A15]